MDIKEKYCNSCKTKLSNLIGSVSFKCPNCNSTDIIRCNHCRSIAARYRCECGSSGPN